MTCGHTKNCVTGVDKIPKVKQAVSSQWWFPGCQNGR